MAKKKVGTKRMRTKAGDPSVTARKKSSATKDRRFPIFDKKSAVSALKLRGHNTTHAQRMAIIRKARKFAPEAAQRALEEEQKRGGK